MTIASVFYINARSITNKLSQLQALVYLKSYDLICISETWLSNEFYDNEILPSNYTIFRKDRLSRGGGVMVAINNSIYSLLLPAPNSLELLCIRFNLITLCLVYIPPNSSQEY